MSVSDGSSPESEESVDWLDMMRGRRGLRNECGSQPGAAMEGRENFEGNFEEGENVEKLQGGETSGRSQSAAELSLFAEVRDGPSGGGSSSSTSKEEAGTTTGGEHETSRSPTDGGAVSSRFASPADIVAPAENINKTSAPGISRYNTTAGVSSSHTTTADEDKTKYSPVTLNAISFLCHTGQLWPFLEPHEACRLRQVCVDCHQGLRYILRRRLNVVQHSSNNCTLGERLARCLARVQRAAAACQKVPKTSATSSEGAVLAVVNGVVPLAPAWVLDSADFAGRSAQKNLSPQSRAAFFRCVWRMFRENCSASAVSSQFYICCAAANTSVVGGESKFSSSSREGGEEVTENIREEEETSISSKLSDALCAAEFFELVRDGSQCVRFFLTPTPHRVEGMRRVGPVFVSRALVVVGGDSDIVGGGPRSSSFSQEDVAVELTGIQVRADSGSGGNFVSGGRRPLQLPERNRPWDELEIEAFDD